MNTLIVEDERKSREVLKHLLEEYCPAVCVTGMAANVAEAREIIREQMPDMVFLDIEMPGGNGFRLLEDFFPAPFSVVITTSYNQYAVRAIRFSAVDYLLKPIEAGELRAAVERAANKTGMVHQEQRLALLKQSLEKSAGKIALPTMEGFHFVAVSEIEYCEADGNYTHVYLVNGQNILVSRTLKEFDDLLSEAGFFRIHQSYLVNLRYMRKFVKAHSSLVTDSGKSLPVASRKKEAFISFLKKL